MGYLGDYLWEGIAVEGSCGRGAVGEQLCEEAVRGSWVRELGNEAVRGSCERELWEGAAGGIFINGYVHINLIILKIPNYVRLHAILKTKTNIQYKF